MSFIDEEEKKENTNNLIQDKNQINSESDKKISGEKTTFMEGNVINLETGKDKSKEEENEGDQFLFS